MADKKFSAASVDPADQTAGGFLDDVDGTILKARYTNDFDYQGKRKPVPALKLTVYVDGAPKTNTEHLTCGNEKKARASKDGLQLLTSGGGIGSKTKLGLFNASIGLAGFPKAKWKTISESIANLEGLYCHFKQVPLPRFADEGDEGEQKARTALTISEIHKLPWENKGFRKKIEAALEDSDSGDDNDEPEETDDSEDEDTDSDSDEESTDEEEEEPEEEADTDEDAEESEDEEAEDGTDPKLAKEATAAIVALLKGKHKKGIAADELPPLVFQAVKASKNKRKIVELVGDEDWLGGNKAFKVAKGKVLPK